MREQNWFLFPEVLLATALHDYKVEREKETLFWVPASQSQSS